MWPRGWVEVYLYSSMATALEGGEWSAARPGRTLSQLKTRHPFYRRLGGPQGLSGRAENLVPTGNRSRAVQPLFSRYTDWATGPTSQPCSNINYNLCVLLYCLFVCPYVCMSVCLYDCEMTRLKIKIKTFCLQEKLVVGKLLCLNMWQAL